MGPSVWINGMVISDLREDGLVGLVGVVGLGE